MKSNRLLRIAAFATVFATVLFASLGDFASALCLLMAGAVAVQNAGRKNPLSCLGAVDVLDTACVGRIVEVSSACGCTLTKTTITGLAPADIVALANKEIYLTKAILDAREAKMLGVPENPLMTLLNSRIKDIKDALQMQKIDEQSIVMPFIQRTQRSFINANYFTVLAGGLTAGAGANGIPVSAWDLTLGLGNSVFQTTLQDIQRFFVPGTTLIVRTWDGVNTKTARTLVFTIYAAVEVDQGSIVKAKVTVYPPVSATNWVGYTAAQKSVWQPYFGMAETGANSVSDYESYCQNQPSDLSRNIVVNWLQTTRESYCREQSYEEVLDLILKGKVNDYLKAFKYQSIAEQQKMMKARYDLNWFNSVFFGQALDVDNQTTANWQNLPIVYDLVNTNCPLAYKASALGIFTLLNTCNRVKDFQGMPLDLTGLFSDLYYLRRWREATGDRVSTIDAMTDRYTFSDIFDAMTKYYKARFNWNTDRFAKMGEKIVHDNLLMFTYDIYDIKEAGVSLAVFNIDYFNDLIDAYNTVVVGWNFQTRANNLWMIDWSDVNVGIGAQKSVTRKNPDPATADIYKCVITPNVRTYDLRSKMWTVMVDRPNRHLIYHNYASGCPRVSIPNCVVPQS